MFVHTGSVVSAGLARASRSLAFAGLFVLVCLGRSGKLYAIEWVDLSLTEGTNFSVSRIPGSSPEAFVMDLQGTLWRVERDGGPAQPLTDGLGDDRLPDVAADGSRVVFQSFRQGNWDIWSVQTDGSGLVALTRSVFDDREPVLSPDGSKLAFSSDRSGNYDIWVVDIDGGDPQQITRHPSNDFMPCWSADSTKLFYVSDRDGGVDNALVEWTLGEGAERLVRRFEGAIASPSVSTDGTWLALRRLSFVPLTLMGSRFDQGESSELMVFSPDEPDVSSRVLKAGNDVFPFRASWTSDDRLVVTADGKIVVLGLEPDSPREEVSFEVKVSLNRAEYVRRAPELPSPGERRPVNGIVRPAVSPDEQSLVYSALGDLWLAPLAGGEATPLTRDESLDAGAAFSPDGSNLVYASDRSGTMDLWIKQMGSSTGSGERQLTFGLGAEWGPAWSPDGSRIAFVDERSRVFVVSVDGGEPTLVYEPGTSVGLPSWSSDGNHLAMAIMQPVSTRFREGLNRILIVSVEAKQARILDEPDRSVGTRDGDGPVWSPDGSHLAFAMDGGLWLMAVRPDGTPTERARQIVAEPADFLAWAGSKSLVFLSGKEIRRVAVDGGRAETVEIEHTYSVAATGGKMLLQDFRLIDGTGASPKAGMDVLIEGERIAEIRPTGDPVPEGVRVIAGQGRTLIPGLIELHTHLSQPTWGRRHGKIWLAFGVTTIRSPAASPYRIQEERESILAGLRAGPRIVATGHTLDGDRVYYGGASSIHGPEGLQQELSRAAAMGYDLIKTYVRLTDDLQRAAIEKAHELGLPVTSHELFPALALGIDGVEHLTGTSRRGFSPKMTELGRSYQDVVSLIAQSGVEFTPTVLIYGGFSLAHAREPDLFDDVRLSRLFPPWAVESLKNRPLADLRTQRRLMQPVYETLGKIHAAGGKIFAGTDSPIVPYGFSLLLELEQLAEAGIGNLELIQAATSGAAAALGLGESLGSLEEGKLADLVILRDDPAENIRALRSTEAVILDGRIVQVPQLLRY